MQSPAKRKSGIKGMDEVAWGTHLCQFYQSKEDLLNFLAPFFKEGLLNNELCLWLISPPLTPEDAKIALGKIVEDVDSYIRKGQLEFIDNNYQNEDLDYQEIFKNWALKEDLALQVGYEGLRISGNAFGANGKKLIEYEKALNSVLNERKMIALCSYYLPDYESAEILETANAHHFAFMKPGGIINSLLKLPEC